MFSFEASNKIFWHFECDEKIILSQPVSATQCGDNNSVQSSDCYKSTFISISHSTKVANLATEFQILVTRMENLGALVPVLGIIIHCSHRLSSHWLKAYS